MLYVMKSKPTEVSSVERISNAFARAGQPCAADVQRWQAAGYRQRADGYWVR